jgi:hypothetical protein
LIGSWQLVLGDVEMAAGRTEAAMVEYQKALHADDHAYYVYAWVAIISTAFGVISSRSAPPLSTGGQIGIVMCAASVTQRRALRRLGDGDRFDFRVD